MKTLIVIPTYNEKQNITKLLGDIFNLGIDELSVLVVDDNSPDGTGQIIDQLKSGNNSLDIMHRPTKAGLGRAYVAGFSEAIVRGANYILQMDADFSHDPKYIPELLRLIQNCDVAIGSRYVAGGGTKNWGWMRRLISKSGNVYARLVLGLPFKDITGGFRCYRRAVLEKINLNEINSIGYVFQTEILYRIHRAGFKVEEIPIIFTDRLSGQSKFSIKIILESFWRIIRLKFNSKN